MDGRETYKALLPTSMIGPVHTAPFSYENGEKLIRFGLAVTLLRCENGALQKR